ncbi:hypothetical protein Bbelb_113520 [Branchiostoma belcheri]|nr:hypothetical protein Bbelb_113520 [Branchiostoma belcheri]
MWVVFSTKDRHVWLFVDVCLPVSPTGQACLAVCGCVFACMWVVFGTKDRHVWLCVVVCLPYVAGFSTKDSTKDRHVRLCVHTEEQRKTHLDISALSSAKDPGIK